jgi:polyribonucleotide nucleotidyltransferase
VRVGRVQGKWVLNPTFQALAHSDMELVVSASNDSIVMVEGGALEVTETDVLDALTVAQKGIRELIAAQEELLDKAGRTPKMEWVKAEAPEGLIARVKELAQGKIADALNQKDKHTRIDAVERAKKELAESLLADFPDGAKDIHTLLGDVEYHSLRSQVLDSGHRVDGRTPTEVRPISIDTGLLPRAHGSALFTRGQTQALVVATLGTAEDVQRLDTIDDPGETTKSFMLHYNFPPFSTGEVRPVRTTSRREIGHGNLAERALQGVLPPFEDFPYTIRDRLRHPRVERLVVHGVGVRRIARAVRCRRSHARPGCRRRHGVDQGRHAATPSSPTSLAPRIISATWTSRSRGRKTASRPSRWTSRSKAST